MSDYPRCATCKHWAKKVLRPYGLCLQIDPADDLVHGDACMKVHGVEDADVDMYTTKQFGCALHEREIDADEETPAEGLLIWDRIVDAADMGGDIALDALASILHPLGIVPDSAIDEQENGA